MNLEQILKKRGIRIKKENGDFRNVVDVIEDMFLKLNKTDFLSIMQEIQEEEMYQNIFDNERGRKYNEN